MDGMKRLSLNHQRSTAIVFHASDVCTHHGKRSHDSFHGAGTDRIIPIQLAGKILSCQNTGDQPGGCATVTYIQDLRWGNKAMQSPAMNQNFVVISLDINTHFAEAGDCRETVCTFQKMRNSGGSVGKSPEHNCSVRN